MKRRSFLKLSAAAATVPFLPSISPAKPRLKPGSELFTYSPKSVSHIVERSHRQNVRFVGGHDSIRLNQIFVNTRNSSIGRVCKVDKNHVRFMSVGRSKMKSEPGDVCILIAFSYQEGPGVMGGAKSGKTDRFY